MCLFLFFFLAYKIMVILIKQLAVISSVHFRIFGLVDAEDMLTEPRWKAVGL